MALVLADRVRETTTTAGTGTITLLGAVPSCQSFAAVGNGNTTYYTIVAYSGTEWEVGIGTYTASGTTLSRDTVLSSSNSGSLVNFSAGTKDVFVDYPAGRAVYEDAAGNVDGYPITGGTINNTTIGATTPSTGVFTTLTGNTTFQFGKSSANYGQGTGGATTKAVEFKALGSDTNVAYAIRTQGTGAIDLAAGSSGVNISNGGTVTAITRTSGGSAYTSLPTAVISAPTTAGGTQATLSPLMAGSTATVVAGGTGYTVGDTLTIVGATGTASQLTVATLSGSAVATVTFTTSGSMSALPSNPVSVTGGTGSGATFNMTYSLAATQSNFTAGSGYVEQPTVTFSGGGGSGATAFATIGSAISFKSLNDLTINLPSGPVLSMTDSSLPGTGAYLNLSNGSTSNAIQRSVGSNTNIGIYWLTKGTGVHSFNTNNSTTTQQLVVSHTASAVNYVQVTGAATTGLPVISAQGSDTNIAMYVTSKGNGTIRFATNNSAQTQLRVSHTTSAVNFVDVTGSASGAAPIISVAGNDTNIDLTLTPKGTGNVRFGTYSSLASTTFSIDGYIEIKDSSGTLRKLAVIV